MAVDSLSFGNFVIAAAIAKCTSTVATIEPVQALHFVGLVRLIENVDRSLRRVASVVDPAFP